MNADQRNEERSCNCKNSKCMKLYCECFSARLPCGKHCRCVGCQNSVPRESVSDRSNIERIPIEDLMRMNRGCACRRSNCTKKYCDCFQLGMLCCSSCKCIGCQNNQSLTNRRVVEELRSKVSDDLPQQSSIKLYSLYITQNNEHLHSIVSQSNPLSLHENWLQQCAHLLYLQSKAETSNIFEAFIQILTQLDTNLAGLASKEAFSEENDMKNEADQQIGTVRKFEQQMGANEEDKDRNQQSQSLEQQSENSNKSNEDIIEDSKNEN